MYKQLRDNVFDGILTAALNEFITEELRLLPTDDELSVMYPTSEKQLKQYRKKAKQKQRKAPTLPVYLKRIAVIALAVISVTFGVLMTNEGVRAAIVKSFITWYDKYVEFDFSRYEEPEKEEEEETDPLAAIDALVIGYVPEGYILSESVEDPGFRQYVYMTDTGEYLVIEICTSNGSSIGLDHVNSDLEKLSLNGKDMYLSYNDTDQYGSIVFGNKMYTMSISGLIAKDELIKIAENITAKQSDDKTITSDDLNIGYIPEGFELTSSDERSGHREYMYTSDNGDYITIGIYDSKYSDIGVDSENTEYEVISVNGREAHLMYDENDRCGVLLFGNSEYYVSIMALTDKSELIKVAENITAEQPQADAEAKTVDDFVIGYIPENFELTSETEDIGFREYIYMSENGDFLMVGIYESEGHSTLLDSENSEYEEITINGHNAYLMYNEVESTGSVVYGDASFSVSITGKVAKDELIKVAENITVKQPQADAEESTKTFKDLEIGYIPENFDLTSETENDYMHEYIYMADNGDYLMVGAYDSESSEHSLDTENSEYEVISVNGYDAYVTYNSDESTGSVIMGNSSYHISITGICAKEELIKVAENIK